MKKNNKRPTGTKAELTSVDEFVKPKEEQVEEPTPEPEDEVEAVVDGVAMNLNIRKNPKVEPNNQVGIVGKGTKLIVMSPKKEQVSADGIHWFKVKFGNPPTVGYAMKKYIRML